ncbi:MAG: hypothetical protein ACI94Y_001469 [Maribacter sp.]|jgi:hypothetical protein
MLKQNNLLPNFVVLNNYQDYILIRTFDESVRFAKGKMESRAKSECKPSVLAKNKP